MTTMDSDSESQDSDDGRRFRFEATRKDANAHLGARTAKSSQKTNYDAHFNDAEHRDRKDRSKHDRKDYSRSSKERDANSKDSRHSVRHSKHAHESRSLRHEDSKDHRDSRDASVGSKNSDTSKQKSRDLKRHRDRGEHRKHRSQERTYDRNSDERSLSEKHKNKSYDKHKQHHSHDKSRDRGYQSDKVKSSDGGRARGDHERHNSHKKTSVKENENQHLREYSPAKNSKDSQNHGEAPSSRVSYESCKRDSSVDSQECRDLDLSEFDILSETDENLSDVSDGRSQSSLLPRYRKTKVKKRGSSEKYESTGKKQATKSERHSEERQKVNAGKNDTLSGASDNNPSAVSDFLLGTASSRRVAIAEDRAYDDGKRFKANANERHVALDSSENVVNTVEETPLHFNSQSSSKETLEEGDSTSSSLAPVVEPPDRVYGPTLPAKLSTNPSNVSSEKPTAFIGPCLPQKTEEDSTKESGSDTCDPEISDSAETSRPSADLRDIANEDSSSDTDLAFGPALPPHLRSKKPDDEARATVVGPVLPSFTGSPDSVEQEATRTSDSDEEDAIGPLPVDHPSLKNNYVHEQLERRARRIKDEQRDESKNTVKLREEWMTELPSAQASNLGLGPRKFRMREGPDLSDRSCWTDTPATKAEKQKKREEERLVNPKAPDVKPVKQSHASDSSKSRKREKSLLEMHQSKLQKKKKKEEKEAKLTGQPTRRPFDRDIDLKANQFDQAQKKTIFMKAQLLDDRFSRGEI